MYIFCDSKMADTQTTDLQTNDTTNIEDKPYDKEELFKTFYNTLYIPLKAGDYKFVEYHIYCNENIEREYAANTRSDFWKDISKHLFAESKASLKDVGFEEINTDYDREGDGYIYVHLPNDNHRQRIRQIVQYLNDNKEIWLQHAFPKLELLVQQKLSSKKFLLQSLIEYQHKHGVEAAKHFVDKYYFLLAKKM